MARAGRPRGADALRQRAQPSVTAARRRLLRGQAAGGARRLERVPEGRRTVRPGGRHGDDGDDGGVRAPEPGRPLRRVTRRGRSCPVAALHHRRPPPSALDREVGDRGADLGVDPRRVRAELPPRDRRARPGERTPELPRQRVVLGQPLGRGRGHGGEPAARRGARPHLRAVGRDRRAARGALRVPHAGRAADGGGRRARPPPDHRRVAAHRRHRAEGRGHLRRRRPARPAQRGRRAPGAGAAHDGAPRRHRPRARRGARGPRRRVGRRGPR